MTLQESHAKVKPVNVNHSAQSLSGSRNNSFVRHTHIHILTWTWAILRSQNVKKYEIGLVSWNMAVVWDFAGDSLLCTFHFVRDFGKSKITASLIVIDSWKLVSKLKRLWNVIWILGKCHFFARHNDNKRWVSLIEGWKNYTDWMDYFHFLESNETKWLWVWANQLADILRVKLSNFFLLT